MFSSLSAKDIFVKIGVVGKQNLFNTFYRVKELNYKPYSIKRNGMVTVYSGPFSEITEAQEALLVIKKEISKTAYLVTFTNNKEKKLSTSSNKSTQKKQYSLSSKPSKVKNKDFFVGLNLGVGLASVDENDNNFDSVSGMSFGVEGGYYFTNNIFMTLNYQHIDLDDVSFDNIYTKLDYKFSDIYPVSPYIGVIAGYSLLTWNDYVDTSDTASTYCYGVELGSEVYVSESIIVGVSYSYTVVDFVTTYNILEESSIISHKGLHNLSFGIKYSFN